jgi:hypothetical protein
MKSFNKFVNPTLIAIRYMTSFIAIFRIYDFLYFLRLLRLAMIYTLFAFGYPTKDLIVQILDRQ